MLRLSPTLPHHMDGGSINGYPISPREGLFPLSEPEWVQQWILQTKANTQEVLMSCSGRNLWVYLQSARRAAWHDRESLKNLSHQKARALGKHRGKVAHEFFELATSILPNSWNRLKEWQYRSSLEKAKIELSRYLHKNSIYSSSWHRSFTVTTKLTCHVATQNPQQGLKMQKLCTSYA